LPTIQEFAEIVKGGAQVHSIVFEKVAQVNFDTMQKFFDCILYYIFSLALISSLQIWVDWGFVLFCECISKRWDQ
jgi:hypothetical protein